MTMRFLRKFKLSSFQYFSTNIKYEELSNGSDVERQGALDVSNRHFLYSNFVSPGIKDNKSTKLNDAILQTCMVTICCDRPAKVTIYIVLFLVSV